MASENKVVSSNNFNQENDDRTSSSGYISNEQRCSLFPDGRSLNSNGSNNSAPNTGVNIRAMYVRRGSLTINNLPQKFSYHNETAITKTTPVVTTPILERRSQSFDQETASAKQSTYDIDYKPDEKFVSTTELQDEGVDMSQRPSSLSHLSTSEPSWRPWTDAKCCFGYIHLRCTWIFHPQGRLSYVWLLIVSIACLHNLIQIPLRFAFNNWNANLAAASSTEEILNGSNGSSALKVIPRLFQPRELVFWMVPDYFFDVIYALDILKSMRTGFFEEGYMTACPKAIMNHYVGSASFYADLLSLLPLDVLYLSFGLNSLLRFPRLIKTYRIFQFIGWTERHTSWPNVVRSTKMFIYILIISHWNAGLCKFAMQGYEEIWFSSDTSTLNSTSSSSNNGTAFFSSSPDLQFYWAWLYVSVSTLCTLGLSGSGGLGYNDPAYVFIFLIFQMMLGLVIFAVAIGEILVIVDRLGAGRREFQMHLDAVKNYMGKRNVPRPVSMKVIRWFDYIWESRQGFDEERRHLMILPENLQADISFHAYLKTLKQVEFFRNTEAGFLKELVLKLKPSLLSPGEFVCRKGEIGRTMYIIELGVLHVFSGKHVTSKPVACLRKGQYFGELSLLNMGKGGNRRTATIRSAGYSHLLTLCKEDLLNVLQDYPKERARLEFFAARRCERYYQEKMLKRQSQEHLNRFILNDAYSGSMVNLAENRELLQTSSQTSSCDESQRQADKSNDLAVSECGYSNQLLDWPEKAAPETPHFHRYRQRQSTLVHRMNAVNISPNSSLFLGASRSIETVTGRESSL